MENCTRNLMVVLPRAEKDRKARFIHRLCCLGTKKVLAQRTRSSRFQAVQGPDGTRFGQCRYSRSFPRSRGIHWCRYLPKKWTGKPPLNRQNDLEASGPNFVTPGHGEKKSSSSPSEGAKAPPGLVCATGATNRGTKARFARPGPPHSIATASPVTTAQPPRRKRHSGPQPGGYLDRSLV